MLLSHMQRSNTLESDCYFNIMQMNLQDWLMEKQGSDDYATLIDGFVEISTNSVGGERPSLKARRQVRLPTFLIALWPQFHCGRTIKARKRCSLKFYYLAVTVCWTFSLFSRASFHISSTFSLYFEAPLFIYLEPHLSIY